MCNLSQPAVLWVLTGDVLVDGKVVATLIRMRLVMNPTPKKVMETARGTGTIGDVAITLAEHHC